MIARIADKNVITIRNLGFYDQVTKHLKVTSLGTSTTQSKVSQDHAKTIHESPVTNTTPNLKGRNSNKNL